MATPAGQRLDRWLWFARIAKTRTLAARLVASGKVRVNRQRVAKPSRLVQPDDVLTLAVHGRIRVLKILDPGTRRGPASEAQQLYEDLSPPVSTRPARTPPPRPQALREKGAGRPTKRDRRRIEAWIGSRMGDAD
jgi:ribosome-associated heat shock protein Hsp15